MAAPGEVPPLGRLFFIFLCCFKQGVGGPVRAGSVRFCGACLVRAGSVRAGSEPCSFGRIRLSVPVRVWRFVPVRVCGPCRFGPVRADSSLWSGGVEKDSWVSRAGSSGSQVLAGSGRAGSSGSTVLACRFVPCRDTPKAPFVPGRDTRCFVTRFSAVLA